MGRSIVFSHNCQWYLIEMESLKVYIIREKPKIIEGEKLNLKLTSLSIYDFDQEVINYVKERLV